MNQHVSCYHHFRFDQVPPAIKAAKYREQFSQLEGFGSAFFRRFPLFDEESGVSFLPDEFVQFVRFFFQETRNLVNRTVYH